MYTKRKTVCPRSSLVAQKQMIFIEQPRKKTTAQKKDKHINILSGATQLTEWKEEGTKERDADTEITIAWVYLSSIQFWLFSSRFAIQSEKYRAFVIASDTLKSALTKRNACVSRRFPVFTFTLGVCVLLLLFPFESALRSVLQNARMLQVIRAYFNIL